MLHPFVLKLYNSIITHNLYDKESYRLKSRDNKNIYHLEVPVLSFKADNKKEYDLGDVFYDEKENKLYIFSLLKKDTNRYIEGVGFKVFEKLNTSNRIGLVGFMYFNEVEVDNLMFVTNVYYNDENKNQLVKDYITTIYPKISMYLLDLIDEDIKEYKSNQTNFFVKVQNHHRLYKFSNLDREFWLNEFNSDFTIYLNIPFLYMNKNKDIPSKGYKAFYAGDLLLMHDNKENDELKELYPDASIEPLFITVSSKTGKIIYLNKENKVVDKPVFIKDLQENNYKVISLLKKLTEEEENEYYKHYLTLI